MEEADEDAVTFTDIAGHTGDDHYNVHSNGVSNTETAWFRIIEDKNSKIYHLKNKEHILTEKMRRRCTELAIQIEEKTNVILTQQRVNNQLEIALEGLKEEVTSLQIDNKALHEIHFRRRRNSIHFNKLSHTIELLEEPEEKNSSREALGSESIVAEAPHSRSTPEPTTAPLHLEIDSSWMCKPVSEVPHTREELTIGNLRARNQVLETLVQRLQRRHLFSDSRIELLVKTFRTTWIFTKGMKNQISKLRSYVVQQMTDSRRDWDLQLRELGGVAMRVKAHAGSPSPKAPKITGAEFEALTSVSLGIKSKLNRIYYDNGELSLIEHDATHESNKSAQYRNNLVVLNRIHSSLPNLNTIITNFADGKSELKAQVRELQVKNRQLQHQVEEFAKTIANHLESIRTLQGEDVSGVATPRRPSRYPNGFNDHNEDLTDDNKDQKVRGRGKKGRRKENSNHVSNTNTKISSFAVNDLVNGMPSDVFLSKLERVVNGMHNLITPEQQSLLDEVLSRTRDMVLDEPPPVQDVDTNTRSGKRKSTIGHGGLVPNPPRNLEFTEPKPPGQPAAKFLISPVGSTYCFKCGKGPYSLQRLCDNCCTVLHYAKEDLKTPKLKVPDPKVAFEEHHMTVRNTMVLPTCDVRPQSSPRVKATQRGV